MSDKRDWPGEVPKDVLLANFRKTRYERLDEPRPPSWRARRPGMSAAYLIAVRTLPCACCYERDGIQAHHLRSGAAAKERGIGLKATDKHALPLCPMHHDEVHRFGSRREREYFHTFGMDCHALCTGMWNAWHRNKDPDDMFAVLQAHKREAIRWLYQQAQELRRTEARN